MSGTIIILDEGDYHSGHRLGLAPEGEIPRKLLPTLGKLWSWREAELAAVGPVDIHILGGDLGDGEGKKGASHLIEPDVGTQADWAEECARRVRLKKGGSRYVCFGSDYHVVAGGTSIERIVARGLGAPIDDTIRLKIRGKRFAWRHFCGRSDIERGQPTQVAREITRELLQEVLDGQEAADVLGRHHVHYYTRADLGDRIGYTCPAWQLPLPDKSVSYPRRLRGQYYHVGYTLIQIDEAGEVFIRPRWMRLVDYFPRRYACPLK